MSLSITTLSNEAAIAKTFTLMSSDSKSSEWLNTTDSGTTQDIRLTVRQSLIGKNKQGVGIRRSLVQARTVAPTSIVSQGNTITVNEEIVVNLTITTPVGLATLNSGHRKDLVAYIRNFVNGTVCEQLARGELA